MTQTWDFRDCGGNARVRIQYNFPSFFVQADFHLLVWYPGRNDLMRHLSSLTTRKPQDGMNTTSPRQRTIFLRAKNSFDPNICTHASQKDWNRYCSRRLHLLLDMVPALLSLSHSQLLHTTSPSPSTSQQHVGLSQPAPNPPNIPQNANTNNPDAWSARPHGHLRPAHQRCVFHAHPPPRPHAPRGGFWGRALWILHRWWALVQGSTGEERQEWDPETAVDCEDYFRSG